MSKKLTTILVVIGLVAITGLALANTAMALPADPDPGSGDGSVTIPTPSGSGVASGDEKALIRRVTNWILGITGAIAVLFIIYGGFRYITASGNQGQMETAKNILVKAIIGLAIIVIAYVIAGVVISALT